MPVERFNRIIPSAVRRTDVAGRQVSFIIAYSTHTVTMRKYKVGNFTLRVGRSSAGRGVFACEDIPRYACIIEYIGREVTDEEMNRDRDKCLFWVSKTKMINGAIRENRARFINHSCAPNCKAEGPNGRVFIMARRKIKAGEELTYHYGKEYFEALIKPKGCKCPKCTAAKKTARRSVRRR